MTGMNTFLTKPVSEERLRKLLTELNFINTNQNKPSEDLT